MQSFEKYFALLASSVSALMFLGMLQGHPETLWWPLATLANCLLWIGYGLALKKLPIVLPNVVGLCVAIFLLFGFVL